MPTFCAEVSWTETGTIKLEAESEEAFRQKVMDMSLPDGHYLTDSFSIDSVCEIEEIRREQTNPETTAKLQG